MKGKGRIIGYWATTGIIALVFGWGGVLDIMTGPDVAAILTHLGYPLYMGKLIGVFKVVATVAVLIPGTPRLKEWAYAGIAVDLIGAAVSHLASGDGPAQVVPPLAFL